jgi:hypothetical protein
MLLASLLVVGLVGMTALRAETVKEADVERVDVKELLKRMKAMENQMATQAQEIGRLKGELHTANEVAGVRPTVDMQVEQALSKKGSDRFFHDPEVHKRPIRIGGSIDISYQFSLNQPEKIDPDGVSVINIDTTTPGATPAFTPTTTGSSAVSPRNVFRVFDRDESNDFSANQAQIYFDGTATCAGEAGFKINLNFGEDTVTGSGITGEQVFTFNNIQEAYIDYIAPIGNGVRFTAGRFVTPVGFEVIETQANWNSTRSFNFGLGIPFTHTGLKVDYDVFKKDNGDALWAVAFYAVNGWDNTLDNNDDKTFMAQSIYAPLDWLTWTVNVSVGNEGGTTGFDESATRYVANSNIWFNPWENWEFAINGTYGVEKDEDQHAARTTRGHKADAIWYGAAGYFKWQFADKWYFAGRGEYFSDEGGTRTGLVDGAGVGQDVSLYSLTATVSWKLADPLEIRFEYRHDGAARNAFNDQTFNPGIDNNNTDPTAGDPSRGGRATQDTFMMNWLYQF